jgi:hypothetical protein
MLQRQYRHHGILVISTTEHREPDLQMKIAIIYLGTPTRLRGSQNNNFIQGLTMNTVHRYEELYVDFKIPSANY